MHHHQSIPELILKLHKAAYRRRQERRRREEEQRRKQIEQLRRRAEEARKRRMRLMLLLLLALIAAMELVRFRFPPRLDYWLEPDPSPAPPPKPERFDNSDREAPTEWTPNPDNDYKPRPGSTNYIDGYDREQWESLMERHRAASGRLSKSEELARDWLADPDRAEFPARYRDLVHKPNLVRLMDDFRHEKSRPDAITALRLMLPTEFHIYLMEAYAIDQADLRQCVGYRDRDILQEFHRRSSLWQERKRQEAEQAQRNSPNLDDNDRKLGR